MILLQEQEMPIEQLLAMYGGYPTEEGESGEGQANGEGEEAMEASEHSNGGKSTWYSAD